MLISCANAMVSQVCLPNFCLDYWATQLFTLRSLLLGSCTVKICWRRLLEFRQIGESLYKKFNGAARVQFAPQKRKLKPAARGKQSIDPDPHSLSHHGAFLLQTWKNRLKEIWSTCKSLLIIVRKTPSLALSALEVESAWRIATEWTAVHSCAVVEGNLMVKYNLIRLGQSLMALFA